MSVHHVRLPRLLKKLEAKADTPLKVVKEGEKKIIKKITK